MGSLGSSSQKFLASLTLTILYAFLLLNTKWGLGFPILTGFTISFFFLLYPQAMQVKKALLFIISAFVLSIFLAIQGFEIGRIINILATFTSLTLGIALTHRRGKDLTLKEQLFTPAIFITHSIREIAKWLNLLTKFGKKQETRWTDKAIKVFAGMLLGVFLVFVFGNLFMSGDPLFEKQVKTLFEKIPDIKISPQVIYDSLHLLFAFGLFSSLLSTRMYTLKEFSLFEVLKKYKTEVKIATGAVAILIAAFLAIQAQFLFAGRQLLEQMGIMHSEYTRRGFFELIVVSGISLLLIGIITSKDKSKTVLLPAIFITEIFLILASATWRVYLYQDSFGFTQARLLGFVFVIWLAGILSLFAGKVADKIDSAKIISSSTFITFGAVLFMNFLNIDYLVGSVKKPNLGHGVDYPYIANLSSDAWPGWKDTIVYLEQKGHCSWESRAIPNLIRKQTQLEEQSKNNWHNLGSWVLADSQALKFLREAEPRLKTLEEKGLNDPYCFTHYRSS